MRISIAVMIVLVAGCRSSHTEQTEGHADRKEDVAAMRKGAAGAIQDLARRLIPDATVTVDGDTLVVANKDGGCDRAGVVALRDNFAGADSPVTVLFRTIRCPDGSVELPTSK